MEMLSLIIAKLIIETMSNSGIAERVLLKMYSNVPKIVLL